MGPFVKDAYIISLARKNKFGFYANILNSVSIQYIFIFYGYY